MRFKKTKNKTVKFYFALYLKFLKYTILFFVVSSFFILIFEIISRLWNKTYFSDKLKILKKSSIIESSLKFNTTYSLLDFIFDIYYLVMNFWIIFLNRKSLVFILSFVFLFILLFFLPLVYVCIFFFFLLLLVFRIIYSLCFNKDFLFTFDFKNFDLNTCVTPFDLLKAYTVIPKIYSGLLVYFLLLRKKHKIDLNFLNAVTFSYFLGKPFWFIQLIFSLSLGLTEIFFNEIWSRKKISAWPRIFFFQIRALLFEKIFVKTTVLFSYCGNYKISISNRKITLNPDELLTIIRNNRQFFQQNKFSEMYSIMVGGQPHLSFCDLKSKKGWVFTNSKKIRTDDGAQILAKKLSHYNSKQQIILSELDFNTLIHKKIYNFNIFQNLRFYNWTEFMGNMLRLNLYYALETSNLKFSQANFGNTKKIEKLEGVQTLTRIFNDDDLIIAEKSRKKVLDQLYKLSNSDVFNIVMKSEHALLASFMGTWRNDFTILIRKDDIRVGEITKLFKN